MCTELFYLAALYDSNVHLWSVSTSATTTNGSSLYAGDDKCLQPSVSKISANSDRSSAKLISWHPVCCKLAALDGVRRQLHIGRVSSPSADCQNVQIEWKQQQHSLISTSHQGQLDGDVPCCFAFSQTSGRYIATGYMNGTVFLYHSGKQLVLKSSIQFCDSQTDSVSLSCIAWALDDRILVAGTSTGRLLLHLAKSDSKDANSVGLLSPAFSNHDRIPSCSVLRTSKFDSRFVIAGYSDGSAAIWQLDWSLDVGSLGSIMLRHFLPTPLDDATDLSTDTAVSLALSAANFDHLITAGFPDLCLRLWSVKLSAGNKPILVTEPTRLVVPKDRELGYVCVDLTPEGSVLATGLLNGEVWIHNVQDLNVPVLKFPSCGSSINQLIFALTVQTNDHVKFSDVVSSVWDSQPALLPTVETSISGSGEVVDAFRHPLGDITNASPSNDKWCSLSDELSLPNFSSITASNSLDSVASAAFITKHETSELTEECHLPQTRLDSPTNFSDTAVGSRIPPVCASSILTSATLESLLNRLHEDVQYDVTTCHMQTLLYLSKLEIQLKSMSEHFKTVIARLHEEVQYLRRKVERHNCPFC